MCCWWSGWVCREKDWSSTPFGPIETWPTCLKVALDIALPNQFPIVRPCTHTHTRTRTRDLRGAPHHALTTLRTARSRTHTRIHAQVIFWGPEYRMLYNDAYRPVFGRDKHPGYIGAMMTASPACLALCSAGRAARRRRGS
jgi:hypothetical protein